MNQTFGASLRAARERKGISLRQIATATKISVAALESLERNDFSKLPGGIFSRAFVKSYAIEVGLDPDETVHRFLQQFEEETGGDRSSVEPPAAAQHHRSLSSGRSPSGDVEPEFDFESKQRMAGVVLKLVAISVPVAAAILYFSSRGGTPPRGRGTAPEPDRAAAHETGNVQPAAVPIAAPVRTQPASPPERRAAFRPPAEGLTVEIAPSADCWAQLTTDGAVVVSRVIKAGERETRTFRDSAVLKVGDAAACAILINGRPARPLGPPRKVREVRITRDNFASFLP